MYILSTDMKKATYDKEVKDAGGEKEAEQWGTSGKRERQRVACYLTAGHKRASANSPQSLRNPLTAAGQPRPSLITMETAPPRHRKQDTEHLPKWSG